MEQQPNKQGDFDPIKKKKSTVNRSCNRPNIVRKKTAIEPIDSANKGSPRNEPQQTKTIPCLFFTLIWFL